MTVVSDTLRLELAPFGVSVITVVLGIVSTGFNDNKLSLILPPKSRYTTIRDTILNWRNGNAGPKGCTASEAAASLVPDILGRGKSGTIWRGDKSLLVKLLSAWTPENLLVRTLVSLQTTMSHSNKTLHQADWLWLRIPLLQEDKDLTNWFRHKLAVYKLRVKITSNTRLIFPVM